MSTRPKPDPAPPEPARTSEPARPRLSLCLATYNRARYLDRYLTHHLTALDAAGIDYELVVSDNCSTDETPEILARYAARFPRMKVSRQPRNLGAHPNILTTLHQARGEIVVSISDDDLAVSDQLLAYVQRMLDDPSLVMIQAPWLLTDETKDGAVIGQFYRLEAEQRFEGGQYGAALVFAIERHVFPECWLMRRDALPAIAGPAPRFTYSYFAMLAHALGKGDVLFCPEPHIAATAISKTAHVGNDEAMEGWDVYRGGLELMASYARQTNPDSFADADAIGAAIQVFVNERMTVAARLQAHAGRWANAYQILRRLHAYGLAPAIEVSHNDVAVLAAVETALLECNQRGAVEIVAGADIPEHVLDRIKPMEGARIVRAPQPGPAGGRRAWCQVGPEPRAPLGPEDFVVDLAAVMERFPLFPA